jgi:hypothetical protein
MRKIILIAIFSVIVTSCTKNDDTVEFNNTVLSQEEIDDLLFLVEEEKLARDVYLYSYNLYSTLIFKNISNSEQTHLNSVLQLINKYNIPSLSLKSAGEFNNQDLQNLYFLLVEKCDESLLSALEVGNLIEDLDIFDISENEKRTDNIDILKVYASLKCGSQNHLRNFNNQLINNGGFYSPKYILENTFNSIINSENEKCGNN